jgi:hypothetical protein
MPTEKASIDRFSTAMADSQDLQSVETNDDVAPEIIGMFIPILACHDS